MWPAAYPVFLTRIKYRFPNTNERWSSMMSFLRRRRTNLGQLTSLRELGIRHKGNVEGVHGRVAWRESLDDVSRLWIASAKSPPRSLEECHCPHDRAHSTALCPLLPLGRSARAHRWTGAVPDVRPESSGWPGRYALSKSSPSGHPWALISTTPLTPSQTSPTSTISSGSSNPACHATDHESNYARHHPPSSGTVMTRHNSWPCNSLYNRS